MERKAALVTGSSHGIGKSIALALAQAGYDVGITYHTRKEGAMELYDTVTALGVSAKVSQVDVSSLPDIQRMFDEFMEAFGRSDVLVNNAGIGLVAPFLSTTPELFETLTNTDWRGGFFSAQRAAQEMLYSIKGTVPDSISYPPGCRFCDRCEENAPACRECEQALLEVEAGHWVRCCKVQKENKA